MKNSTITGVVCTTIEQVLERIEPEHNVTILYACESGSRAWGFASPDSDYDVRFIYVHRPAWYMTVHPGRDVIELPINGDLDINGWELRKALGLMLKSNPVLSEWLNSPIVYKRVDPYVTDLRNLAQNYFQPHTGYHHYLSMARKTFHDHLRGDCVRYKKYFYALRPLLAAQWIGEGRGTPPMNFLTLLNATNMSPLLKEAIDRLLEIKMQSSETQEGGHFHIVKDFIESRLSEHDEHGHDTYKASIPINKNRPPTHILDDFLFKTVQNLANQDRDSDFDSKFETQRQDRPRA